MTQTDVVEWLYGLVVAGLPADADMGRMEKAVEAASLEVRRQVVERLAQQAADRCSAKCPGCGGRLSRHVRGRKRWVMTRCGQICFRRDYGRCPSCGRYSYPADVALGLHERATASPLVQEICALETLSGPAGCKAKDVRRLTRLDIDPSVMHREARRQGEAALALRDSDAAMAQTPNGAADLAAAAAPGLPGVPFTLVIEIDAWNIRERDAWGRTAKLAADRFKGASQRVDRFHVDQHLCTLAADLHGAGTEAAREWAAPYRAWLTKRTNGALDVLRGLEGLRDTARKLATAQRAALEREIGYFNRHKDRMDYKHARTSGQPVGSGAVESTCAQYQRRFKLTGQFWSLEGDEAFLALDTLHRNERWHLLFPHDRD